MGIGTSLGAFFETELDHHAANDVIQTSDHTGFVPSDNIEDRRDEPDPNAPEWKNVIPSIQELVRTTGDNLWGSRTPSIPEAPVSELSKKLGHEDVKIVPDVGRSLLERAMDDIHAGIHTISQAKDAFTNLRRGYDNNYNTVLSLDEHDKFVDWKAKNAPKDSGEDYDLRGAFKAGVTPDKDTGHWPDTFKKPNHPTFSDQSKYAKDAPDLAGSWDGDTFIPPALK